MQPKSLSATALHVADLCLARYAAEQFFRARGTGNRQAADLGTAVHGALEMFVKIVCIEKSQPWDFTLLDMFYRKSYMDTFDTVELGEGFEEGLEMLKRWFERTDVNDVEVISCEKKDNFLVPTSVGEIPFNYIWDRFDKLDERTYRVVDYKSSAWSMRPEDLKKKIQARAYALAAGIQLKSQGIEYDKIWVQFDMLRHDPVGIVFSRQEVLDTWNFIKDTVEKKILPTDVEKAPEKLNPECRFCVRKQTCKALQINILAGGIFGLSIEQVIDRRAALEFQKAGVIAAINELDEVILTEAKASDVTSLESDINLAYLGITSTNRKVNADQVEIIVGPHIFEEYGAKSMAIGQWEKLKKDKRLTEAQKKKLESVVYKPPGNVTVRVKSKSAFGDE